jgi:hypothetical protein
MKYDPQMVRDFIEHLKLSLRVEHLQLTTSTPSTLQPELLECIRNLSLKYNVASLVPQRRVCKDREDLTDKEVEEADRRFRANAAAEGDGQLKDLERMGALFEHAYLMAAGQDANVNIPASKILDGTFSPKAES